MKKIFSLLFALTLSIQAFSAACLTNYLYRVPITLTNNDVSALTNIQVKVPINTQVLVSSGKMRIDGGDVRFTDSSGTNLPYWFDAAQFNSTTTDFWVKVNSIPLGQIKIYLFYGNPAAAFVSSGDATFELFDDFNGTAIDNSKWTRCGDISNFSVSGGIINLKSNATNTDGIIYSNQTFASDVVVESDVKIVSKGQALLGFTNSNRDGYATSMETSFGNNNIRLSRIANTALLPCQEVNPFLLPALGAPINLVGTWSFKWPSASTQIIGWPGGAFSATYTDPTNAAIFGNNKQVILGSTINAASDNGLLSVSWLRVRKLVVDPFVSPGLEQNYPVAPNASNSGPYCGGATIQFNSTFYPGAVYNWISPSGVPFSSIFNPSIPASSPLNSGQYSLEVSLPGCPAVVSGTTVVISPTSNAGATSGNTTLCSGSNSGIVSVSGITGTVIRWEMSNDAAGPWFTISSTSSFISYSNLIQTTYFRPVVKTSSCPEAIGDPAIIVIDKPTVGGFVIGGTSVCSGANGGTLNLVYRNGNIVKWQSSTDGGINWADIISNDSSYTYTNLIATTRFRAEVKNGFCSSVFSAYAEVVVNPLPQASFSAAEVCEGFPTSFVNSSTIASGNINNYQWDFGNSSSSISSNPIYIYPLPGSYVVGLTAVSSAGCVNDTQLVVIINPLPKVSFSAPSVCLGTATTFQAIVSVSNGGSVSMYSWDHGNGSNSILGNHTYTYPSTGLYNVQLTATTNKGCKDSIRNYIEVAAPVNVNFTFDSVCLGQSNTFINTSSTSSPNVAYTWDFGNGATSVLSNPVYTYPAKGQYTVTLQAQVIGTASACISSVQKTILIYEVPVPDFSLSNVCLVDSAAFLNSTFYSGTPANVSYSWNFGDASSSLLSNPKHLYATQGNFNVTLTSNTLEGCAASVTKLISIYPMPTANFSFNDVCLLNNMNFTSSSTVSTGTLSYIWDFKDGSTLSPVQNPIHLYATQGSYNVQLIITSNNNCRDTISKTVSVYPLPFVDYANTPVCDGSPSSFSQLVTITSGSISYYSWDFGDGGASTSGIATHQYLNPGTYQVKLTATSNFGCINDSTKPVSVNPNPVANFTAEDACLNAANQFTNTSIVLGSGPLSYVWDFGDGATSSLTSPNHTYSNSGIFLVKLIVSSGPGCLDSLVKYTESFPLPLVYAGKDSSISRGKEVQLNATSPYGSAYTWTPLTNINNSSIADPIVRPVETTTYVLTMTDTNGCKNTDELTITVLNDYKLLVYNVLTPDGNGKNDTWQIGGIDYYPEAKVQVFNRWGEKVYEKTEYQNDWAGTYKNDELPDGSYYYVISFPQTDINYKGTLTLLRNK